jgi:hypothetical protein
MNETEFDKFAGEYGMLHAQNVNITGESFDYFFEYKIRDIFNQISKTRSSCEDFRSLDFGNGIGSSIPFYRRYFPSCYIVCADVSRRSLELAKRRFGELASYVLFERAMCYSKEKAFP